MSQVPASIGKLYELMASGQFEIPHSAEAEAAIEIWLQEQLGDRSLLMFARSEVLKLEPELNPWPSPGRFHGRGSTFRRAVMSVH